MTGAYSLFELDTNEFNGFTLHGLPSEEILNTCDGSGQHQIIRW